MPVGRKLGRRFYAQDTLGVARELLGQRLVRMVDGQRLSGLIVETEAYMGPADPASHARYGPESRAAPMFGESGHAYVYFTYGMYYCVNTVTEPTGSGTAVLIRALEPLEGLKQMRANRLAKRSGRVISDRQLADGPGKLCVAFGIDTQLNRAHLLGDELWVERMPKLSDSRVATSARVGIREGREHQWRFYIKDNPHVSKHPSY